MKRIVISAFLAILIFQGVKAQQDPMFTQYMFNQLLINPAYAGNRGLVSGTAFFRNQWVNIKGAPVTESFTVDAPFKKDKVGIGLSFFNDQIGVTKNTGIYGSYSYRIKIGSSYILSLGLEAGFSHLSAKYTDIKYTSDESLSDVAFDQNYSAWSPNFGGGIFFNNEKMYAGLSVPRILQKSLFQKQDLQGYTQMQHYFLTGGYVIDISNDFKVKPSALVKFVPGAPVEIELNGTLWFFNLLAVGVTYRSADSFDALLQLQVNKQLLIGYSFDYNTTALNKVNAGSHEIMLRYDLSFSKSKIISPRYF